MKFKKALKFLVPIFGVATLSVALPLTLTSCSNSEDNNPIQFTENLPATSYATNANGVELTVGANLNGQSSDNLYYKWFYKVNGAKDPNPNNVLEVNGYKLAIPNQQNDTNTLHVTAEQLKGYSVSFRCAVYENGNDTVVNWSNPTTVKMATVVNTYNSNTLDTYLNNLDTAQIENAIVAKDFKQIVVNANCGLTADQIASVVPNVGIAAPTSTLTGGGGNGSSSTSSTTNSQFANLSDLVLDLAITLNPQYQFDTGDRVVNVNNITPDLKEIEINQSVLNTTIANLCDSDGYKSAQEVIQKNFATSEQIIKFFTNGTANVNGAQYITSATATVGTSANSPLQQIVFNLTTANGYLINGQRQISISAGTSFLTNPEALFLSTKNLERFITGLNLVQSVNANALGQSSVSYNAHGCVDGVHGGTTNDDMTNSKPHEEGFPPEVTNPQNNAVNTVPTNQGGKLFNLIMATLGFDKAQAEQVEFVTIKRVNNGTSDQKVACQNNEVGLNIPFMITVQLKDGASWANTNGSDVSTQSGRVNFSNMNGWTDYKAVFTNQPNDSKLTIYTNLVGVSLSVNMDQPNTDGMNTNLINLSPNALGTFVNAVYPAFSSDSTNQNYVLTPESNAAQFNKVADLLNLPAGLFSKFIFKCDNQHQVEFKAVLIKGAVMYGPTTMHETKDNWKITCEKIFCDENGNIPNWQAAVGQDSQHKPNYQQPAGGEDHTMANPCKYAGFKITWKNDKTVDVSETNIQNLITKFSTSLSSINANQVYNESMTINNPTSSSVSKTNTSALDEEPTVLDPSTKQTEIFNGVLKDLGIDTQSNAVKSMTISRASNNTTSDVNGIGLSMPLNIEITLNPGYTFGNNSGLTSWVDKNDSFAVGSRGTTEYIASFTNDTTTKGNSVLKIATNEIGFMLGVNFGQNATGEVCFNQQKLNTFAKAVYSQMKINTNQTITSDNPEFTKVAKELGLPAELFHSFIFQEGSNKEVKVTCLLKKYIDFSGGQQFKSSDSHVTVQKGNYKMMGTSSLFAFPGMQITWTNQQ